MTLDDFLRRTRLEDALEGRDRAEEAFWAALEALVPTLQVDE